MNGGEGPKRCDTRIRVSQLFFLFSGKAMLLSLPELTAVDMVELETFLERTSPKDYCWSAKDIVYLKRIEEEEELARQLNREDVLAEIVKKNPAYDFTKEDLTIIGRKMLRLEALYLCEHKQV